jgi:hypothetical protein
MFYGELNLLAGYSEKYEWIGEAPGGLKNSVGFEYFGKASNDYGDFLTWDLQVRLGYHTRLPSGERWGLEFHSAWLEYKLGLGKGIRAGHFSPAFGLEPGVDTHGTPFQTLAIQDIGFKKDWGVGYRGAVSIFDYSVALQLGSGVTIDRKDGSVLVTGRIGTPAGGVFEWGASVLAGRVLYSMPMRAIPRPTVSDEATPKWRLGADAKYVWGAFLLMGEASFGKDEEQDVVGLLFQTDYTVPSTQALTAQFQARYWADDPGTAERSTATLAFGGSYALGPALTLRVVLLHDIEKHGDNEDTRGYVQVYYFGA